MDVARTLTAQELARQCARSVERARQGERPSEPGRADPVLNTRLRKVRASRQRVRAARRLGIELH